MADQELVATGLILRLRRGDETEFTDVARVVDITPPTAEMEEVDITNQLDEWRRKIPNGIKDSGDATFLVNSIIDDFEDGYGTVGAAVDVEVVFPVTPAQALRFSGYIRSFETGGFALGEKIDHTITIMVSGPVTVGAPTA